MKTFLIFTVCVFISINMQANKKLAEITNNQDIEIEFKSSIKAKDLKIKKLIANITGDTVLFTLTYSSNKDRYMSFFNPPSGSKFKIIKVDGINKNDSIVKFIVSKDVLKSLDLITMRFSITNWFVRDGNFIFLDMNCIREKIFKTKPAYILSMNYHRKKINEFKEFRDVRWDDLTPVEDALTYEKIATLNFNKNTNFGKHKDDADQIMENSKNPGLGVRSLHKQGITGKGVKIAIITQNLPGNHPEYKDRIIKYKDFGCKQPKNKGSMLGSGTLSSLAGLNTGTAPEVQVYYAAIPSWKNDGKYHADALKWVIKENQKVTKENKIRLIVTAVPPNFQKNDNLWDEALKMAEVDGIVILSSTKDMGFIGPCYYDLDNPEDVSKCKVGWPDQTDTLKMQHRQFYAPGSRRTLAEEYNKDENSYQYYGKMSYAWTNPYVAGIMAMGWQIKPDIDGEQMVKYLINTSFKNQQGYKIIDPVNFIKYLQELK